MGKIFWKEILISKMEPVDCINHFIFSWFFFSLSLFLCSSSTWKCDKKKKRRRKRWKMIDRWSKNSHHSPTWIKSNFPWYFFRNVNGCAMKMYGLPAEVSMQCDNRKCVVSYIIFIFRLFENIHSRWWHRKQQKKEEEKNPGRNL